MADSSLIRLVSTSTVRPASGDHGGEFSRRIELSPSDLITLQMAGIRRGLLFHKPVSITTFDIVERMKEALSRALVIFFPLAGRLVEIKDNDDTQTTSFCFDCNDEGALFVHAVADSVTVGDILAEVVTVSDEIFSSLFALSRVLNFEAAHSKLPLLAVQVTELTDGVFVACTMNHALADGTTFWHFFNVWSEISCSGGKVFRNPVFDRKYLDGLVDLPLRIPISLGQTRVSPATTLQTRVVHFSKEKISKLKAKVNSDKTGTAVISSLQAVMAHLWVCVTRSRRLDPKSKAVYVVAVGLRPRLEPPLLEFYFGNAYMPVVVAATAGELLDRGTVWAASRMSNAISGQTPGEARKFLVEWKERIYQVAQRESASVMITGGSTRFDVYGNDFGWGRPVACRGLLSRIDGGAPVYPGSEEGSIDFALVLQPETFCGLANDTEFAGTFGK